MPEENNTAVVHKRRTIGQEDKRETTVTQSNIHKHSAGETLQDGWMDGWSDGRIGNDDVCMFGVPCANERAFNTKLHLHKSRLVQIRSSADGCSVRL